jgi:hypothetical protein
MTNKRKNSNPVAKQVHPQLSFQQLLADATLAKFSGYINEQIQALAEKLTEYQATLQKQSTQDLMTRIVSLEEIVMQNIPTVTKEVLASQVATVEDRSEGLNQVSDGEVELNDRVRVEIKTKTTDQTDFQGSSRLRIDGVGSGSTLGKELEGSILGMKVGETKEVKFGKDGNLIASILLSRTSRAPKTESAVPPPPQTEGAANASANAG